MRSITKFYFFLEVLLAAGWIWIMLHFNSADSYSVCLFKKVTGIPCPSCGTTRAVVDIVDGNFLQGLMLNPLGLFFLLLLITLPFLLIAELLRKKYSLFEFFNHADKFLKTRRAVPVYVLIILNWVWNIYKGL